MATLLGGITVRDDLISRGLPLGFEESLVMRDRGVIRVSLGTLLMGVLL